MSLSADSIIDRIKLKEQIMRWRAGAVLCAVLLALFIVSKTSSPNGTLVTGSYIARVSVDGLIQQDNERDQILKEIAENRHIKAVVLLVNSPGGTMVGSEVLYKRLRGIAKQKPVVAVMQELAASGGYMTAIAANRVFAQRGTITGSIGVLLQTAEVTEMAEKLGIKLYTFKSSPLKGSPSPLEKMTPEVSQEVNGLVKANYDIFVDIVSEARGLPKQDVEVLANGRVYTGLQAVENKLIDGIGGEDEALAWLGQRDTNLKELPVKDVKLYREKNGWAEAFKSLSGLKNAPVSMAGLSLNLSGVLALWQPNAM